jgi:membrane-associated protease RseP (regulator of RpoE activity)
VKRYGLHIGLFVATCITTTLAIDWKFSATLMAILLCHEMGHYVVARRHGVDASLPYFIPMPPYVTLGTMGAIIRMNKPIDDRNKLIDVGAAGPIAGLVVAVPLLIYGLSISPVGPAAEGGLIEGNSIAYLGLKYLVKGQLLPAADGTDVQLHSIAFAAWVGLLITFINLIPIGQLDGGHIACAFLGDRHERMSRWLHAGLLLIGAAVMAVLGLEALDAGKSAGSALGYGLSNGAPWLVWAALLLWMRRAQGGIYHPAVGDTPLSPGRRLLVFSMAVVFLLIFTPVPLREALP